MKLEVDYMVDTLKAVLEPMIAEGSLKCSNIDSYRRAWIYH